MSMNELFKRYMGLSDAQKIALFCRLFGRLEAKPPYCVFDFFEELEDLVNVFEKEMANYGTGREEGNATAAR